MFTDIRSGSRWISAILLSIVLHVGLLTLLVVTSGNDGEGRQDVEKVQDEKKVQEGENVARASSPLHENVARASSPLHKEVENPPVNPPVDEPMTPETIARADRGNVADIGKGFDESKRVKNVKKKVEKVQGVEDDNTTFTYYIVRKGDTLTHIAREYGMTPLALAKLNGYAKPLSVRLRVGQKLKVQAKQP